MFFKQTEPSLYPQTKKKGCLYMALLYISCKTADESLVPFEVNKILDYASPMYVDKANCYVLDLPEIIRLGLYILGKRFAVVEYSFRVDSGVYIVGDEASEAKANHFIMEMDCGSYTHFVVTDREHNILYNPGMSVGVPVSYRGFHTKVLM